jgi:hypothetical protein
MGWGCQNRGPRRIFGFKREHVTTKSFAKFIFVFIYHSSYKIEDEMDGTYSTNVEITNVYKHFVWKPEPLERSWRKKADTVLCLKHL